MERKTRQRREFKKQHTEPMDEKMERLIAKIRTDLSDSIIPISLTRLSPFERKQIHRAFDRDPSVTTKTYRIG